jgi:outer membrane protein assembly factor BamB
MKPLSDSSRSLRLRGKFFTAKTRSAQRVAKTLLLIFIAAPLLAAQTNLDKPFVRSWTYLTPEISRQTVAADRERVYLPLAKGRVVALALADGRELWRADLTSNLLTDLLATERAVYVATASSADQSTLSALDKRTGSIIWGRQFPSEITSLTAEGRTGRLFIGSRDGTLHYIAENDGQTLWTAKTGGSVRGKAVGAGDAVYIGSDDGAFYSLDAQTGQTNWRFQARGPVRSRAAVDDRTVYVGASDGYVYSLTRKKGKLRWKRRTGAAVEAGLLQLDRRVIALSFDNFVYALDSGDGRVVWNLRLGGRITFDPIADQTFLLVCALRTNHVLVVKRSDGTPATTFSLEPDREIISPPIVIAESLILATSEGLIVARHSRADGPRGRGAWEQRGSSRLAQVRGYFLGKLLHFLGFQQGHAGEGEGNGRDRQRDRISKPPIHA